MTHRFPWTSFGVWLAACLLIAGSITAHGVRSDGLPTAMPSGLASSSWSVPGAQWVLIPPVIRNVLAVLGGAWAITALCRDLEVSRSWSLFPLLMGLSLLFQPGDGVAMVLLYLVARMGPKTESTTQDWQLAGIGVTAILMTLEFGLVLGAVLVKLCQPASNEVRPGVGRRLIFPSLWLAGVIGTAMVIPGFSWAAIRPVSWLWMRPAASMMPSLHPAWDSMQFTLPLVLVATTCIVHFRSERNVSRIVWMLILVGVAIQSQRYLFLGLCGLWLWLRPRTVTGCPTPGFGPLLVVCLILSGGYGIYGMGWATLLTGQTIVRSIDPTLWDSRGRVVLMNLDHSAHWSSPLAQERFELLLDDRWDSWGGALKGGSLSDYVAFCRDLREVRDLRYRRVDGTWGGYQSRMETWNPMLLVVDSSDHLSIRGLSLSPDWRIMGIDGQQTIFGRVGDPRNTIQIRHALDCLMTLEWPARLDQFTLDNTLVSGDSHEDQQVAGAMCSLRFPYAALRLARHDQQNHALRARCLLELAHRVASHSSTGSLLDQFRAVIVVQQSLSHRTLEPEIRKTMDRGLQALLDRTTPPLKPNPDELSRLRMAFLTGNSSEIQHLLIGLPPVQANYYQILVRSPGLPPDEIVVELKNAIPPLVGQVPDSTLSECHFYLGCAALESGRIEIAIPAFEESRQLAPNSPFRMIRELYLNQLRR
ncbi:MAG: hypothetical protein DWH91_01155 [Planctomycetota bacterium]|nr:MAG: hypothetical protein DWH91_01155 [Planctomycetota bacterium]